MKDIRLHPVRIGCDRACAKMPCGWGACWQSLFRTSRKFMGWWRLWKFKLRVYGHAPDRPVSPSLCSNKIADDGTSSSFNEDLRHLSAPMRWAVRSDLIDCRQRLLPAMHRHVQWKRQIGNG